MIGNYNYGTGRRKSAVARVFIKSGSGQIVVNGKLPLAATFFRGQIERSIHDELVKELSKPA